MGAVKGGASVSDSALCQWVRAPSTHAPAHTRYHCHPEHTATATHLRIHHHHVRMLLVIFPDTTASPQPHLNLNSVTSKAVPSGAAAISSSCTAGKGDARVSKGQFHDLRLPQLHSYSTIATTSATQPSSHPAAYQPPPTNPFTPPYAHLHDGTVAVRDRCR